MRTSEAPRTPDPELEAMLRAALSSVGDGFDTEGLLSVTHERVTRRRRRHALVTVAATGVTAVAVVTAWHAVAPSAGTPEQLQVASEASRDMQSQQGSAGQDDAEQVQTEDAQEVPWQPEAPPLTQEEQDLGTTDGEVDPSDGAWQIPDPRPTGVAFLDDLGAPYAHHPGRDIPVDGMVGNDQAREGGLAPVAGESWSYAEEDPERPGEITNKIGARAVYLHVTGWEDGQAAMEGLRDDELRYIWGEDFVLGTWQGRADDPDRLAFEPYEWVEHNLDTGERTPVGTYSSTAVLRTGDYLVAVTVTADSAGDADALAREISEKTAENLAVLDPEHATD